MVHCPRRRLPADALTARLFDLLTTARAPVAAGQVEAGAPAAPEMALVPALPAGRRRGWRAPDVCEDARALALVRRGEPEDGEPRSEGRMRWSGWSGTRSLLMQGAAGAVRVLLGQEAPAAFGERLGR